MAEDFFGALGKKITQATHSAVDKTSSLMETGKINAQISGEHKEIEKICQKLGEAVLRKAEAGLMQLDESEAALIEEVGGHRERISELRQKLAEVKGMKICPACDELIDAGVAFCPKCGAPTPVPVKETVSEGEVPIETEGEAAEAVSEAAEAAAEKAEAAAEAVSEAAGAAEDKAEAACEAACEAAGEAAEAVSDAVSEAVGDAAEAASDAVSDAAEAVSDAVSGAAEAAAKAADAEADVIDAAFTTIDDPAEK